MRFAPATVMALPLNAIVIVEPVTFVHLKLLSVYLSSLAQISLNSSWYVNFNTYWSRLLSVSDVPARQLVDEYFKMGDVSSKMVESKGMVLARECVVRLLPL